MLHETTTAKDAWAAPRPAGHSVDEVVPVAGHVPATLYRHSIVRPPAYPGLVLAIPHELAEQAITTLTRNAVAGLLHPDDLASETAFGPSAYRLREVGVPAPLAASVGRWGSAVYCLADRLTDARGATETASRKHRAEVARRKEMDAVDDVVMRRSRTGWGSWNMETAEQVRAHREQRPALQPPQEPKPARLDRAQLKGRLDYLLSGGGLPSRAAMALAVGFDGMGWSETVVLLDDTAAVAKDRLARLAYDATAWMGREWQLISR